MEKLKIEGSFVSLITPCNRDGTVDFEGFRTLIDFQATNGTGALLIKGSTGEVSMLTREERQEIISKTVRFKKGTCSFFTAARVIHRGTKDKVE
jgi:4-hydroxy-tetrahydrodipicolinate synthase